MVHGLPVHRRQVVVVTLAVAMVWAASTATAEAGDTFAKAVSLAWDAPPGCPTRGQVLAEVVRLLGETRAMPEDGAVEARASVENGTKWTVSITTLNAGRAGRRSIAAASCEDLADATAMIIALMIDPDAVAAHSRDPKAAPPLAARPAAAEAPSPPGRPMDVLAAIHGQAGLGVLPGVDAGVGAGVGLAGRRWRVEVRGTYGLRRDQVARARSAPEAYGRFNFLGGAFAACINLGGDEIAFGPCADVEAGLVSAQGYNVTVGFPARRPWLALGGGGYAAIALGRHFAIPVHVDVLAPLLRPRYVIRELEGTVFQAPAVGVRLASGIEGRF